MYSFLIVLSIIICVLLVLVVLIQNPKGGGLSSSFGGGSSSQVMGVQRTGDFLEKATWGLAIALLAISLSTKFFIGGTESVGESVIQEQIDRKAAPMQQTPVLPNTSTTEENSGDTSGK